MKEANKSGAKIAVSFHTNAGGGDGSETFYYNTSTEGKKLAKLCEKHTQAIGQNSRGVKATTTLKFCKDTDMTAVLCECAFIDNDKDNDIIDTVAEQKKFGVAYAKAILEYLDITYKEKVVATTTDKLYYVKVGAYSDKKNAEAMVEKLKAKGFDAYITC